MNNEENYFNDRFDDTIEGLCDEIPHWLIVAIQQKNPRVTLALADSVLLKFDELDKKLVIVTSLN